MAQIGRWGNEITFQVNADSQLTFNDMKTSTKARWAVHIIPLSLPRTEYLGIEQESVSLSVTFSARRGQKPLRDIRKLQTACQKGYEHYLYIGGKRIGSGKCYIESIDTEWDEVWNKGELVQATAAITFKGSR